MMDPESLTGRTTVVTGGGSGWGAATARVLFEVGMVVAALDFDRAAAPCGASRNGEPMLRTMG